MSTSNDVVSKEVKAHVRVEDKPIAKETSYICGGQSTQTPTTIPTCTSSNSNSSLDHIDHALFFHHREESVMRGSFQILGSSFDNLEETNEKDGQDEVGPHLFSTALSCPAIISSEKSDPSVAELKKILNLDATISTNLFTNKVNGGSGSASENEKAMRKRVLEFFGDSGYTFPSASSDFPTFLAQEIITGKILGRGGFSDVAEIPYIQCLKRSMDGKACLEQAEHDGPVENAARNKESRSFMAKHCRREGSGGEARYAIKRLRSDIVNDKDLFYAGLGDLVIETRFLYHLEHPSIIKLRGIAAVDPFSEDYFIVMDRLYDTLQERLKQWAQQEIKAKSFFCRMACGKSEKLRRELLKEQLTAAFDLGGALEYLHEECRVCHRDLKPENIGFDIRGDIKIFDLGLARDMKSLDADQEGLYLMSSMTGTLRYMAPCVALGKKYNESCDVYSFCILLWHMLSLETPFTAFSEQDIFIEQVFQQRNRPPLPETWSLSLKNMLRSGWHHDAKDRLDMSSIRAILRREFGNVCADTDTIASDRKLQRRRSTFVYPYRSQRQRRSVRSVLNLKEEPSWMTR